MLTTCTIHPIFLDVIKQIIYGDEHKSRSSSLCNFLQPPVTSSSLDLRC
jgi:hypothetical protein